MAEIILGPPGTGKTTTLLNIVDEELAAGTEPNRIGYMSFTRKAAGEAIDRACSKFHLMPTELPYFRTLHSLCFQSLGYSHASVLEGKKLQEFGEWAKLEISRQLNFDDFNPGYTEADRALFMENRSRTMCVPLQTLYKQNDDNLSWTFVKYVADSLATYKKTKHMVDFTDMLSEFIERGWTPDLDVLLIDEAQDLSMLQWKVVEKLASGVRRVVYAGDDDQAIYRWAGAAVEHFVDLEGDVTVLNQSYRVPKMIQQVGNEIIRRIPHRREKHWNPRDEWGSVEYVLSLEEIDLSDDSILILVRNTFMYKEIEEELNRRGVLYTIKDQKSVRNKTLHAIRAWETLRKGKPVLASDALQAYSLMSSGTKVARGHKTLKGFAQSEYVTIDDLRSKGGLLTDEIWHDALDRIPQQERAYLLSALRKGEKLTEDPRIHVSTIHGAKGGEADHVVLFNGMAKRTYEEYLENPHDEARVWYVAVTRARKKLTIVDSGLVNFYNL